MTNNDVARYLNSLSQHESYLSGAILKSSEHEVTETVFRIMPDGQKTGPYIRKTIKRESGLGQAYERIFAEEHAGAGRTFKHIPRIYDCYLHNDELVIIMEYVVGETLQDLVYKHDPSLELVASVFPQICDAVIELHETFSPPLIHRDLKPSNIMVAQDNVLVIDFGIAREYKDATDSDTTYFGTRAYAPPEQFGYGQTTVRSDVYALGMLLYFCLVEKTPEPRTVEAGFPEQEIPEPLRNVIKRATAFDPHNRYASIREMKAAIEAALVQLGCPTKTPVPAPSQASSPAPSPAPASAPMPAPTSAPSPIPAPQAAQAMASAPVYTQPVAPTKEPGAFSTALGIIRNVVIAFFAILIIVASISCIINVPESMQKFPRWVNNIGYSFFVPVLTIYFAFVLWDKRRLRKQFPNTIGIWKPYHSLILGGVLCTLTFIFLFIAAAVQVATT